jgi:hypothetical protein
MQPIAVTEIVSKVYTISTALNLPYIRVKNSGAYPVRITKVLGGSGQNISVLCGVGGNISDHFYMAPGEEGEFGYANWYGTGVSPGNHGIDIFLTGTSSGCGLKAASSICENSTASPGMLNVQNFGFEYIEYIDGQQITKREIGAKPLMVKCLAPG